MIAYASRALNKAERNYCITEKELLAVRFFIEYFRQYLLGRKFTICTDHQALVWLFRLKEPRGKIARWIEILSHYNFSIEVSNGAKIRNRYNQVPHLTQDTNGKVTNSQKTPQTRAKRSALSQQVTKKHI